MSRTHYILIGLVGLWLTGCSSVPPQAPANLGTLESEAAMAAQAGNAAVAAGLYRQLADLSRGSARSGYLILATRFAFELGNLNQTELWLDEARASAAAAQLPEIDLLSARQLIERGSDLNALELLNRLPAQMPIVLAAESSGLRGRALFALGRYADAVATLVDREIWLDSSAEILANQRLIWDGLRELGTVPEPSGDDIVDGWLALAPFTELSGEGTEFLRSLTEWRSRFSNHPAAGGILAELLASQRSSGQRPNRIALLLPMSSARRTLAMAVRDGFLAAHLATEMQAGEVISIYDTSTRGSVDAYSQAQFDGADIIVGPLLREGVDEIIPLAGFIPTLALNYSQQETVLTPPSLYQFALAPEDEARAVAERAIAMGQKRAVALFASTDLGYRLMNSFYWEFNYLLYTPPY
jgi:outer membrane PBP1 activator LpoA protein